jgi:hypothetical protein
MEGTGDQSVVTNVRTEELQRKGRVSKKRGAPLPDEFKLEPTDWEWAHENCPSIDAAMATKQFVTYWRANGGLKVRWHQAWRNWLLKDEERHSNGKTASRTFL